MPPDTASMIVQLNSPLKPILQAAFNSLTEAGIKDTLLLEEWEGSSIPQNYEVETMVLTKVGDFSFNKWSNDIGFLSHLILF